MKQYHNICDKTFSQKDGLRLYFGNYSFIFVVVFVYFFACLFVVCSSFNLPNSKLIFNLSQKY